MSAKNVGELLGQHCDGWNVGIPAHKVGEAYQGDLAEMERLRDLTAELNLNAQRTDVVIAERDAARAELAERDTGPGLVIDQLEGTVKGLRQQLAEAKAVKDTASHNARVFSDRLHALEGRIEALADKAGYAEDEPTFTVADLSEKLDRAAKESETWTEAPSPTAMRRLAIMARELEAEVKRLRAENAVLSEAKYAPAWQLSQNLDATMTQLDAYRAAVAEVRTQCQWHEGSQLVSGPRIIAILDKLPKETP